MKRGIIVSIQGYSLSTTNELAREAASAGAMALRTDKPIKLDGMNFCERPPVIGLHKNHVHAPSREPYITVTIADAQAVSKWADYVAVDCRRCNPARADIAAWCKTNGVKMIADIENIEDWQEIRDLYYDFVATTFSVFHKNHRPDVALIAALAAAGEKKIIAEGNYTTRLDVQTALETGAHAVCIGAAISNVYKLTRKFTTIEF
jgi:N-acylglucosamine-6-phosphate 2-epimerase